MHSCAYIHALLSAYTSIGRHLPLLKGTRHRGAIRVENLLSSSSIPNTMMVIVPPSQHSPHNNILLFSSLPHPKHPTMQTIAV
jgi:hypothetical protein